MPRWTHITEKPFGPVNIDDNHPLAEGLLACYPLNEAGGPTAHCLIDPANNLTATTAGWAPDGFGSTNFVGLGSGGVSPAVAAAGAVDPGTISFGVVYRCILGNVGTRQIFGAYSGSFIQWSLALNSSS